LTGSRSTGDEPQGIERSRLTASAPGADPRDIDDDTGSDDDPPISPTGSPVLTGPPGGRIFTLEQRPVPSLYLSAWLFSVGGIAALLIATQAQPSTGRSVMAFAGILALGIGLAAGAGYQVVARGSRRADLYHGPSPLMLFGLVLVISTLGSAILGVANLVDPDQPLGFLFGLLVVGFAYLVCIELFVARAGALSWAEMGWPTRHPGLLRDGLRDVGVAMLVMIPATIVVILWGGLLASVLQVSAPETLPVAHGSTEALAVVVAAAVIAPIGEEAFFRGFALSAWLRDLGERPALIRSSLFFAFVHILNIRVSPGQESQGLGQALLEFGVILPLGFLLGWLFLRRGIVAAIAGHMTYNGLLLVLLAISRSATTGT
jgi:membrane protease YdiL (CAAX protease family)